MKKNLVLVVMAISVVATWYSCQTKPNQEAAAADTTSASKHSAAFTGSVNEALQAYYVVSESLVAWDSAAVAQQSVELQEKLNGIQLDELGEDSLTYQSAQPTLQATQEQAAAVVAANGLEAKRRAFHSLSQNMYDLLRTVRYDAQTVYLQECPMAFNDTETGNWLSATEKIRNPYLGLHHPRYKGGMLACGETKDSLSFTGVQ